MSTNQIVGSFLENNPFQQISSFYIEELNKNMSWSNLGIPYTDFSSLTSFISPETIESFRKSIPFVSLPNILDFINISDSPIFYKKEDEIFEDLEVEADRIYHFGLALSRLGNPYLPDSAEHLYKLYHYIEKGSVSILHILGEGILEKFLDSPDKEKETTLLIYKDEIIERCSEITSITEDFLIDDFYGLTTQRVIDFLKESITSFESNNFIAAQAVSTIAIDSIRRLFKNDRGSKLPVPAPKNNKQEEHLLKKYNTLYKLRNYMISYPYTEIMARFNRERQDTVPKNYNRHASIHSLSKDQYREHNALVSIMFVASFVIWSTTLISYPEAESDNHKNLNS